jgi:signal transduction histidine kinase
MSISPDMIAIALLCRPDGALIEVIHDEIGIKANRTLFSLIHASSLRKAKRFLKTAVASHAALDWELDVTLAHGISRLFFSASMTGQGIVILGMKDAVRLGVLPDGAGSAAARAAVGTSLHQLKSKRESKVRVRKRLGSELLRLTKTAASQAAVPQADSKVSPAGQANLLKMLAHDLRNPISGILAASQYLIEDAADSLDSQQLTLLRSIESSSGLMLRLIGDLLEVSSAGVKKLKLHLRQTDLVELVEKSAAAHRPLALARNIQIAVEKNGTVPRLDLDPVKMTQAINTLLTNAVRSSRSGSVIEISLSTLPGRVVISIPVQVGDSPSEASSPAVQSGRRIRYGNSFTLSMTRSIVACTTPPGSLPIR